MTPVQILLFAGITLLIFEIFQLRRKTRHRNAYQILEELSISLDCTFQKQCLDDDIVSLRFESEEIMDQVLNGIQIAARVYGYVYSLKKFDLKFSKFTLEKDDLKISFEIHCLLSRFNSGATSLYYLRPQ